MGKIGGFLEISRKDAGYRPTQERIKDFKAVDLSLSELDLKNQAARCMECGIPFCHAFGCPVVNIIPEFNDALYRGKWKDGLEILLSTNNFPEFTGRVCPAPCEGSCVLGINDDPVAIKSIELALIERGFQEGYIDENPPAKRFNERVAVIGSGAAGLAAADILNKRGYNVTVYESSPRPGGILMYGIPDFKLEKTIVMRRIRLMEKQGVIFENNVTVGTDISINYLLTRYNAILLSGGAVVPRDLPIQGREYKGIFQAMDFLTAQNKENAGIVIPPEQRIRGTGKKIVIIGGGDTGSDCLGTSIRHGAKQVTQIEIMPKPPEKRADYTPWPQWPVMMRESSSHKEGGTRMWSVKTNRFIEKDGNVSAIQCSKVEWEQDKQGRPMKMTDVPSSDFELEADMVILAMGFVGPGVSKVVKELNLEISNRGFVKIDANYSTSAPGIFCAGDMSDGPSLIVRAIDNGRKAAQGICEYLKKI